MLTAGETLDEIEEIMQDVTEQYNQRWESMLHTMFEDLYGTLDDLDGALLRADDALPQMRELLQQGNDTEVKGAELLAKLNEAVPAAKSEIQRLSAIMNHFTRHCQKCQHLSKVFFQHGIWSALYNGSIRFCSHFCPSPMPLAPCGKPFLAQWQKIFFMISGIWQFSAPSD